MSAAACLKSNPKTTRFPMASPGTPATASGPPEVAYAIGDEYEPQLPISIKTFFGIGQIAEGVKNTGFTTFLLFY